MKKQKRSIGNNKAIARRGLRNGQTIDRKKFTKMNIGNTFFIVLSTTQHVSQKRIPDQPESRLQ
jgi:hypothetical protein